MHPLKKLSLCLLLAITAHGQLAKDKPTPPKPAAEAIVGVWYGTTPAGDEFITFTADGRAILQRGVGETMTMSYKVDATTQPFRLDMSGKVKDTPVEVFTVFDFPEPDQFHMAPPAIDKDKRPDAKALQDAKVRMKRITLGAHNGIYQVVEAILKKLDATWEGKDGSETVSITFAANGTYSMKVASFTDKGRFRIDVTKLPIAVDLLSSEGAGVKYSIFEFTADGHLRVGTAPVHEAERPTKFDDSSAKTYTRKEAAPVAPAPPK